MSPASANLLATYLAIGRAMPGAETREAEGYVALTSDVPHAAGNFAARLSLDPWSAGELRDLAGSRPAFQAMALPEDGPPHLAELLRRAGFEAVQRLVAMAATPPFGLVGLDMAECEGEERSRVGRFMADAFFARDPILLRQAMAEALAGAPEVSLYAHHLRDRPAAAVALSREAGVLGLYNVCVAASHRGRRMGSSLVAWCLAQAAAEGRMACLQCAPTLEAWYAGQGFVRTGVVTVWSLANAA